ncbi:hypothetical protein N5853_13625 (plasmid) [Bartonella sp. HY329]|uniref:hypothetical protein n=1 Tax=unclassified Bartonella TaxID=2645622 RepID=UPI0021CA118A|nr:MULTISPECIES: hypothetical protein [unclassified Bartonella]UXM96573.1 hypothetical protein N5853_13625 [Bartonella sp. HY329]UXN10896.1 hypothetical protein N5852_13630 [Bartonella sp. HY328]
MRSAIFIILAIFLFPFACFSQTVAVDSWQAEEKAQIERDFTAYVEAVKSKNAVRVAAFLPPAILEYIAKRGGLDVVKFKADMIHWLYQEYNSFTSLNIEFQPENIRYRQAAGGDKYAIIPYVSHVKIETAETYDMEGSSIGLIIDGKSYFYSILTTDGINIVKTVFPQFKDMDISTE